jgi:histidine ammonia-lyase
MSAVVIGAKALALEDVTRVALQGEQVRLHDAPAFVARIERGAAVIAQRLEAQIPTYGVNTGFGASVKNSVPAALAQTLSTNLVRYHGCGVGPLLSAAEGRAVLLVRLSSLAHGMSGVRPQVLDRLAALLNHGITPAIPSRGSVGASGDLTPLSYVAAVLQGERTVYVHGELMNAADALGRAQISPLALGPKESLAIMNGTSVMAARTALAWSRSERLLRMSCLLTAMLVAAIDGQVGCFDARIADAKGHPGQSESARQLRFFLALQEQPREKSRSLQDPYSIRCAPHIIGALADALAFSRAVTEREIAGASDNPLIDPETGDVLHGGNFYGGHIAMVADLLKTQIANLGDLLERQLVLLNRSERSGLSENLVAASQEGTAHHGFKAMEITASALAAEALKLTMPASVFSRSTEGHNQDKVSMGSLSAHDLSTIVELVETIAAIAWIACAQAVELRGVAKCPAPVQRAHAVLRRKVAFMLHDRALDRDIEQATVLLREDAALTTLLHEGAA